MNTRVQHPARPNLYPSPTLRPPALQGAQQDEPDGVLLHRGRLSPRRAAPQPSRADIDQLERLTRRTHLSAAGSAAAARRHNASPTPPPPRSPPLGAPSPPPSPPPSPLAGPPPSRLREGDGKGFAERGDAAAGERTRPAGGLFREGRGWDDRERYEAHGEEQYEGQGEGWYEAGHQYSGQPPLFGNSASRIGYVALADRGREDGGSPRAALRRHAYSPHASGRGSPPLRARERRSVPSPGRDAPRAADLHDGSRADLPRRPAPSHCRALSDDLATPSFRGHPRAGRSHPPARRGGHSAPDRGPRDTPPLLPPPAPPAPPPFYCRRDAARPFSPLPPPPSRSASPRARHARAISAHACMDGGARDVRGPSLEAVRGGGYWWGEAGFEALEPEMGGFGESDEEGSFSHQRGGPGMRRPRPRTDDLYARPSRYGSGGGHGLREQGAAYEEEYDAGSDAGYAHGISSPQLSHARYGRPDHVPHMYGRGAEGGVSPQPGDPQLYRVDYRSRASIPHVPQHGGMSADAHVRPYGQNYPHLRQEEYERAAGGSRFGAAHAASSSQRAGSSAFHAHAQHGSYQDDYSRDFGTQGFPPEYDDSDFSQLINMHRRTAEQAAQMSAELLRREQANAQQMRAYVAEMTKANQQSFQQYMHAYNPANGGVPFVPQYTYGGVGTPVTPGAASGSAAQGLAAGAAQLGGQFLHNGMGHGRMATKLAQGLVQGYTGDGFAGAAQAAGNIAGGLAGAFMNM